MSNDALPQTAAGRFARRLLKAMDDQGWPTRGRGARLVRACAVSQPTVTGWLKGLYMPEPEKVLQIARLLEVDYMWLYFGSIGTNEPRAGYSTRARALATTFDELSEEAQVTAERVIKALALAPNKGQ